MENKRIEKLSEILAFILRLMGGECFSKTKLIKIIYILDVIKARMGIHGFSGAQFKSYYYGPFSEDIEESIELLKAVGSLNVHQKEGMNGNTYYHFKLKSPAFFGHLDEKDKDELQKLIGPLVNLDLQRLLDLAYATKEYKETPFGKTIEL